MSREFNNSTFDISKRLEELTNKPLQEQDQSRALQTLQNENNKLKNRIAFLEAQSRALADILQEKLLLKEEPQNLNYVSSFKAN